jgi:SPW repeat.
MPDGSRHASDIRSHPDAPEMRRRYEAVSASHEAVATDMLLLLTGLYLAISPWVFHRGDTNITANNLILGLTVVVFGLGFALIPERMKRLSPVIPLIGLWMIISPWVVSTGHSATAGTIWTNVVLGAVILALGLFTMMKAMGSGSTEQRAMR